MKFERGVDFIVFIWLYVFIILGFVELICVKVVVRLCNGFWCCCCFIMVDGFRVKEDSLWMFIKKWINVYGD